MKCDIRVKACGHTVAEMSCDIKLEKKNKIII
jgi:hypothetical protein